MMTFCCMLGTGSAPGSPAGSCRSGALWWGMVFCTESACREAGYNYPEAPRRAAQGTTVCIPSAAQQSKVYARNHSNYYNPRLALSKALASQVTISKGAGLWTRATGVGTFTGYWSGGGNWPTSACGQLRPALFPGCHPQPHSRLQGSDLGCCKQGSFLLSRFWSCTGKICRMCREYQRKRRSWGKWWDGHYSKGLLAARMWRICAVGACDEKGIAQRWWDQLGQGKNSEKINWKINTIIWQGVLNCFLALYILNQSFGVGSEG